MSDVATAAAMRQLIDRAAIENVLFRYCRGVDRCDEALVRSAYWPDACDDHGLFKGDREGLLKWLMPYLRAELESSVHTVTNHLIEFVSPGRAYSEAIFTGTYRVMRDGAPWDRMSCGRYVDLFERRDGDWRILHRTVVNDWARADPVTTPATLRTPGARSTEDPVYQLRQRYLA